MLHTLINPLQELQNADKQRVIPEKKQECKNIIFLIKVQNKGKEMVANVRLNKQPIV
jgi:hypothetical protein